MKHRGLLLREYGLVRGFFLMIALVIGLGSVVGQVGIMMQLPPPGKFNPEDFVKLLSFQNHTGQTQQVYLVATVEEGTSGLIYSGTSAIFALAPGFSNPHYSVYEPITTDYLNTSYEKSILQTNSLPSGEYVVCVWVKEGSTGNTLGTQCIPHSIFHPSAPVPVYPVGVFQVPEPYPLFQWLPPTPLPATPVVYTLTIAEMHPGQPPVEAMMSNPPFFRTEGIEGLSYAYPIHMPPMLTGSRYVWQVQALTETGIPVGENQGFSEVEGFQFGMDAEPSITILHPVAACVGEVTAEINTTSATIGWLASGHFSQFQVVVYENPCGRFSPPSGEKPPTTPPGKTPPQYPTGPKGEKPKTTGKPTGVHDSVTVVPADSLIKKGVGEPVTTPWEPDTSGKGITVVPSGGGMAGIKDWPEEPEANRPPLPPGWAWGEVGPYWTGEHPPAPPDLPPGWEWGPLRPHWVGTGTPPPGRTILHISQPVDAALQTLHTTETYYEINTPLDQALQPGQAFIYQVYGIYQNTSGEAQGYLSESQCLRYSPLSETEEKPAPLPCNICHVRLEPRIGAKMDGGLDPPNDSMNIARDDFVVLKAVGKDFDELWWFCTPGPDCPETPSADARVTSSRVRFTWKIIRGEGAFVEIGCSGKKRETQGERVIFMPPYVAPDGEEKTIIQLSVIDDNKGQPIDPTVVRTVTITTRRERKSLQEYTVLIESDSFRLPSEPQIPELTPGTCITQGPVWTREHDLTTPRPRLPEVQGANKMVSGEMVRLYADDIRDPDKIKVWCHSEQCDTNVFTRDFGDDVEFEWNIVQGAGSFLKGNKGRWVVFQASDTTGEVVIEVRASNPSALKVKDRKSDGGRIRIEVFQPGVRMEITPFEWLPVADSTRLLEKRSYLVYKEKDQWKPGLEHQCRIHLVQLINVSNEPGICLNWPYQSDREDMFVDECPDITIKLSGKYEEYDTVTCERWGCNGDETWFMGAGSRTPERELRVKVMVWDYGAYGFIRSGANGDGSLTQPYESVGWTRKDYFHPILGTKLREYADNRVTIPRDADENQIADTGYYATTFYKTPLNSPGVEQLVTKSKVRDKMRADLDVDRKPAVRPVGDGISNYEEYRGFMARNRHQRLDPEQMNFFVYDHSNLGTGKFGNTGIRLVLVDQAEMEQETRVINRNRKTHQLGYDQLGTILWINPLLPENGVAGYVNEIGLKECDTVHINQWVVDLGQQWVDYIVAHELSHAIGARHHGSGNIIGWLNPGDTLKINGKDSINTSGEQVFFMVMLPQGVSSGDERCWMRYCRMTEYCFAPGFSVTIPYDNLDEFYNVRMDLKNTRLIKRQDLTMGSTLTNQVTGSGVNSSGHCGGKASDGSGDCLNQIKINQKP